MPTHEILRTRHLRVLGAALILAFALPIYLGEWLMPNLAGLGYPIGFLPKLMLLLPGLSGLALVGLAATASSVRRALLLLGVALVPVVAIALSATVRSVLGATVQADLVPHWSLLFLALAWTAMFGGHRAVAYGASGPAAPVVAALGGILAIAALLVPMPGPAVELPALLPLRLVRSSYGGAGLALVLVAAIATAAALSLANLRDRRPGTARWASACLVGCGLLIVLPLAIAATRGPLTSMSGNSVWGALLAVLKGGLWLVGLYLVLPFALAELLIGRAAPIGVAGRRETVE